MPLISLAQISEDFNAGFSDAWEGDRNAFIINETFELQLNAEGAGNSMLMHSSIFSDAYRWHVFTRLDFAPSASNALMILLATDSDMRNAIGLEIGESGSADSWRLFERIDGESSILGSSTNTYGDGFEGDITVLHANGQWIVSVEIEGTSEQILQVAHTFTPAAYTHFGFQCRYTSTRADKFFFDDILLTQDTNFVDTIAPGLEMLSTAGDNTLLLSFSEPLDVATVIPANFRLNDNLPSNVILENERAVVLTSESPLLTEVPNILTINDLSDLAGNLLDTFVLFQFVPEVAFVAFDVLITELMIDPSPSVGLPAAEFIELYNASAQTIDLSNLILEWRDEIIALPPASLRANDYALIVDMADIELFQGFDRVYSVSDFPNLRNSGDMLLLRHENGQYLHSIAYDDTWYNDPAKDDGGYSLALKDLSAPCFLETAWMASSELVGGSPGMANTVVDVNSTLQLRSIAIDSNVVRVSYNRLIVRTDQITMHVLEGPDPERINIIAPFNQFEIVFDSFIPLEGLLEIQFEDCVGNQRRDTIVLTKPSLAEPGDILINEILFSGSSSAVDYVEIVNVSEKFLEVDNLFLGNFYQGNRVEAIRLKTVVAPGAYVVLTESPQTVEQLYPVKDPSVIFRQDLPTLNNDAGNVTLYAQRSGNEVVIDAFDYRADQHDPRLNSIIDVSLERISLESPSQNDFNWYSAASTVSFGTPGRPNSQQSVGRTMGNFQLRSETFSPDGDGFEDLLFIDYTLEQSDFLANMEVFSARGVSVFKASNLLLGKEGFLHWNGRSSDGELLKLGRYLIRLEWYSPAGIVEDKVLSCVLAY